MSEKLREALAERLGEFERIATRIASLNNERSLGHASGIREVVDNLRLLLRDAALARADAGLWAEEADSEQDAELADATLEAALAQRAPERSEVDVERLRKAIHAWVGGPDELVNQATEFIAVEYARLAEQRRLSPPDPDAPFMDPDAAALMPHVVAEQGEQG